MRLSHIDLLSVLTIVAGGVIGASLSFSFLGSRAGDVPAPELVVAPSAALQTVRIEVPPVRIEVLPINIRGFSSVEIGDGTIVYVDGVRVEPSR